MGRVVAGPWRRSRAARLGDDAGPVTVALNDAMDAARAWVAKGGKDAPEGVRRARVVAGKVSAALSQLGDALRVLAVAAMPALPSAAALVDTTMAPFRAKRDALDTLLARTESSTDPADVVALLDASRAGVDAYNALVQALLDAGFGALQVAGIDFRPLVQAVADLASWLGRVIRGVASILLIAGAVVALALLSRRDDR